MRNPLKECADEERRARQPAPRSDEDKVMGELDSIVLLLAVIMSVMGVL